MPDRGVAPVLGVVLLVALTVVTAAAVVVDGDPVGSTGGERLWTVAPRGETTINATHQGETITVETIVE